MPITEEYPGDQLLDEFMNQLKVERGLAANTIVAYSHDLVSFFDFLKQRGVFPIQISQEDLLSFIAEKKNLVSPRSLARCLVSIRMFYRFLVSEGKIDSNPARLMGIPKMYQHLPNVFRMDELEALLLHPDSHTILVKRD